jgi:glycosyltransferase involved in cell wall biosynthesis
VIPLFNEELLISELVKRVDLNAQIVNKDYEIILIDDGSTDSTWNRISEEALNNKRIKGIQFSRNFGHHYAITAGLNESVGDWVVVMDGDMQDRPEVIPDLYRKAKEGYDIVFVSRKNRPESKSYKFLQKLFYILLNLLSGLNFDSSQANFSIINRKVVDATKDFSEYSRFYVSTINWLGFKRSSILADHGRRFSGSPSYTLKKRVKLASDIILSFSERPLRFAIYLGAIISTTAIIGALWMLLASFSGELEITGWKSLMIAFLFFNGILLVVIGLTGVYIGKIFQQVKSRPLYVITDKTS